jgi:RNA polymerase sigma factor (sigma-70 family)
MQTTGRRSFEELMRAAQSGDGPAYAQLLNDLAPRIRAIVRKQRPFLKDADVEDLVQEILISIHVARRTYDPERPFIPWLLAIVRNRMADAARQYAQQAAHEVQVEDFSVTFSELATNPPTEEDYGDPQLLKRAIRELPRGQRKAVEMLKLREMTLKEAATESGRSVGSLKVSMHRALISLREALGKGPKNDGNRQTR